MLTKKVTDDDNFMSLSSSAQALYLHLSMSADDDGFSNQVAISMFKAHASVQDLQALLEKRYIYQFENGVIVIKHWRMANALRKDRYTPTAFQEELKQLKLKANGSYTWNLEENNDWLPDGCQEVAVCLPQVRLDKDSIDKNKKEKINKKKNDEPKHQHGEYHHVLLTDEEYKRLVDDYGESALLDGIKNVDEYCQEHGKSYKDYNLTLRKWGIKAPKLEQKTQNNTKGVYNPRTGQTRIGQ